jgi:DNA-binding transcriptional LysR family regulator
MVGLFNSRMRQLELRHLECLDAVAREESFGRAAKSLGVGQPFVSLSIQRLEAALGEMLVQRRPNVRLTEAGCAALEHFRAALFALSGAVSAVQALKDGEAGEIRLGFPNWLAPTPLPEWIAAFSQAYPRITLSYVTTSTRDQLDALREGRLDLGFIREPVLDGNDLHKISLIEEQFVLALPTSRQAASRTTVTLESFSEDRFLIFPREFAPGLYDIVAGLLGRAGHAGRVVTAAPDWYAILALVRAGGGLAVLPASMAQSRLPGLVFEQLDDVEERSTIAAVHRAGDKVGAVRKLVEVLQENGSLIRTPV